jgi:dethiobiotin synthetase
MRGVFVTGTDTGVGKTTVSRALLGAAVARGLRAVAMKPIETGCCRVHGELIASDADALSKAANQRAPYEWCCPYRFEPPVAPSVAARQAGVRIEFGVIQRAHDALVTSSPDFLLLEGAGGLLVPVDDEGRTFADLVQHFGYPVILVARDRIGVINHTLLTLEAARRRGIEVRGVVLNAVDEAECVTGNLQELQRLGVASLGRFPATAPGTDLAQVAERELRLDVVFKE